MSRTWNREHNLLHPEQEVYSFQWKTCGDQYYLFWNKNTNLYCMRVSSVRGNINIKMANDIDQTELERIIIERMRFRDCSCYIPIEVYDKP